MAFSIAVWRGALRLGEFQPVDTVKRKPFRINDDFLHHAFEHGRFKLQHRLGFFQQQFDAVNDTTNLVRSLKLPQFPPQFFDFLVVTVASLYKNSRINTSLGLQPCE